MFTLTQIAVVEPNGRSEWLNVEPCQQIGLDSTSGDGERTDPGAATELSFSQNRIVKAKVTEVFLQVYNSRLLII